MFYHFIHLLTAWVANQLKVANPNKAKDWIIGVLFVSKIKEEWTYHDVSEVPNPLNWVATSWKINISDPWYMWFIRIWILPKQENTKDNYYSKFFNSIFSLISFFIKFLLNTVWIILSWPVNKSIYILSEIGKRIDHSRLSLEVDTIIRSNLKIHRNIHWIIFIVGLFLLWQVTTTPLSAWSQFFFTLIVWALSIILVHMKGRFVSLALSILSLITLCRYAWWRVSYTLHFESYTEAILGYCLLAAEFYTWLIVLLGFIQAAWPLKREALSLPEDNSLWPTVDIYIPTYNEPMSVVEPTVLAAMGLDWPKEKINIYLLDDGKRENFKEFAQNLGIGYIIRNNNNHAKAGNLNNALKHTNGELIAIFDCDHMPVRNFLTETCGWLYFDKKCALVQTPHHFFSPDPFERNLRTFKKVPNEGALFYGLVQDGNDFWNATFFCGSCAVLRRTALEEIGGIAVETVTEDAHTALKLHRRGWRTAYINKTLAAGLATESLSAHIGQRIRWARGMTQILRMDNPFLGKGLTIFQRICYSNAMLHFLFGIPRLIFLIAPLAFLLFDINIIYTTSLLLILYVIPYIVQANIANGYIQGRYRHTLWAEVYETVLAWYITIPTTVALFFPKLGKFNVTAKGGIVQENYFDWKISKPYGFLILLNIIGFSFGIWKIFTIENPQTTAIIINLVWCFYSIVILGAAIAVATETRQVRQTHRVVDNFPASLYLPDGRVMHVQCNDYSMSGIGLHVENIDLLEKHTRVHVGLYKGHEEHAFPMKVMQHRKDGLMGLELQEISTLQKMDYVQCTFARADAWNNWKKEQTIGGMKQSIVKIFEISIVNYKVFIKFLMSKMTAALKNKKENSESLNNYD